MAWDPRLFIICCVGMGTLFQPSGTLFPELESAAHIHIAQVESEGLISECFLSSSGAFCKSLHLQH